MLLNLPSGGNIMKQFKKLLSYVIGITLALGIGLSYAYAVGANDTNAFVTKQEWQEKVDQIDTAIANLSSTINATTMDFFINGPRLQTSLVTGFENVGGSNYMGFPGLYNYADATLATIFNYYRPGNTLYLSDQWDGSQAATSYSYHTSNQSYSEHSCKWRFAVQTTDPNIYVIVSIYYYDPTTNNRGEVYLGQFDYVMLGDGAKSYASARTLLVELPFSQWWTISGDAAPPTQSETSTNLYTGTVADGRTMPYSVYYATGNNGPDALSNPATGSMTRSIGVNNVTFTLKFPANCCTIRQLNTASPYCVWDVFPMNMRGRKYGGPNDRVLITSSPVANTVAKVYSPQKGCLCLKSYINGEIPILNE